MRLIDADALVKFLKGCTMSNGTLINTNTMLAVVEKMPTAYDVEKVVAELEECSDKYKSSSCEYEQGKAFSYKNAIDIVKRGGVE